VTGRLGRRYARALLKLAREAGTLEATGTDLAAAAATFAEPRLRVVLLTPVIERTKRLDIARQILATLGLSKMVVNLISILAARDRLALLPDVASAYEALLDDELSRTRVHIRSATALGAAEKAEIVEMARKLTGRQTVLATTDVDPDVLAGVILDAGGTVYDGSLRTRLERLGAEMAEGGV
jgi:F-type H+-transporting ATPase subunit delta